MTPKGGSLKDFNYREAPYVFYRNGLYYFLWSVDDTDHLTIMWLMERQLLLWER